MADTSPEFFQTGYFNAQFSDTKNGEHFIVEDLLDFPNDETMVAADDGGFDAAMAGTSPDSSTLTAADVASCNSSFSTAEHEHFQPPADFGGSRSSSGGGQFSGELCVPCDDLAELEWLSNFVEESFSTEDMEKMKLLQGMKTRPEQIGSPEAHKYHFQPEPARPDLTNRREVPVPAKARSKRSRAAPGNWASRLLVVSPAPPTTAAMSSSSSESDPAAAKKPPAAQKKREVRPESAGGGGEGRRCLHCATDKTPQWRTGPMGPKTLCNACGVRYKSGRLVPEYRPAASPTFVLTKHSNSHRKVLELRRQKEMMRAHQQQFLHHHHDQSVMFDNVSNGDDYLIHQHIGPDYRQLI